MEDIARAFHFKNLKRAVEQFARGEKVIPAISYLKDGKAVEVVSVKGGSVQTALRIIEEKFEPDAVNVVLLPSRPVPFSPDGTTPVVPKHILFAMTFDHLGSRWASLFEVRKDGDSVELLDVGPKGSGAKNVPLQPPPFGGLDFPMHPAKPLRCNLGSLRLRREKLIQALRDRCQAG